MGDDDNQMSEPSQGGTSELVGDLGKFINGMDNVIMRYDYPGKPVLLFIVGFPLFSGHEKGKRPNIIIQYFIIFIGTKPVSFQHSLR